MMLAVAAISAPAPGATVAMDDIAGILVVRATIDGKGPYHFVVDTGAGITVITARLAKTLHLQPEGADTANGMGANAVRIQRLTLSSVSVGNATQHGVPAAVIPLPVDLTYQGRYGTIDGILGYSFLRNYAVTLDVARKSATFTPNAAFTPPPRLAPLPVTFAEGTIPSVQARVGDANGRFEIDSGNNGNIALAKEFALAGEILKPGAPYLSSQYQGVGGRMTTKRVRLDTVRIGTATLHALTADIPNADGGVMQKDHFDGNFGYEVIRRFVVTLDYAGARLYLRPGPDFDAYKPLVGTGVIPGRNADGTFEVIGTIEGSPAAKAGIKPGETILAVNGRRAASMSIADYNAALGKSAGARVTYTIRSKGSLRRLTVTTVDMLPSRSSQSG